jgi:hypothetical protein
VKYTPAGGRVWIEARAEGPAVVIGVGDTGIGEAELPRVWERLHRGDASRSGRGLGLGLSLVEAIVEAHGGRVAVRSTPGQGSVFAITLPAEDAPLLARVRLESVIPRIAPGQLAGPRAAPPGRAGRQRVRLAARRFWTACSPRTDLKAMEEATSPAQAGSMAMARLMWATARSA